MKLTLAVLQPSHFLLLVEWLNAPHVHQWWNPEIIWTIENVIEKYTSYTYGYKLVNGEHKPIQAYIIEANDVPIGYFQIYNAYDFERNPPINNLPESLGAFDIFIGDSNYLHQGIGTKIILLGLSPQYNSFKTILVDTHIKNNAARRAYEKAGFAVIEIDEKSENIRMLKVL